MRFGCNTRKWWRLWTSEKVRPREAAGQERLKNATHAADRPGTSPPVEEPDARKQAPLVAQWPVGREKRQKSELSVEMSQHGRGAARNYAGDDYFGCVYCGWQGYKPVEKPDFNVPVATVRPDG